MAEHVDLSKALDHPATVLDNHNPRSDHAGATALRQYEVDHDVTFVALDNSDLRELYGVHDQSDETLDRITAQGPPTLERVTVVCFAFAIENQKASKLLGLDGVRGEIPTNRISREYDENPYDLSEFTEDDPFSGN